MAHRTPQIRRALAHAGPLPYLLLIMLLLTASGAAAAVQRAGDPLQQAWANLVARGSYAADSRIELTHTPDLRLENAGLSPTHEAFAMHADVNLATAALDLQFLNSSGGFASMSGVTAVRVRAGQSEVRLPDGTWQPTPTAPGAWSATSDMQAYLAAARNTTLAGQEQRGGIPVTRYTFDVSGPAFAEHTAGQIEQQLRAQNCLPAGASFDLASAYAAATGTGELWVGADGLPVRQIVHLRLPDAARGETVDLAMTLDYVHIAPLGLGGQPAQWLRSGALERPLQQAGLLAGLLGAMLFVARAPRRRPVYAALITLALVAMLTTPLLQAHKVAAFAAEVAATAPAAPPAPPVVASAPARRYDPQRAPLTSAARALAPTGADTDADGLDDAQEAIAGTNPSLADTDDDGLNDGVEVLELATNPLGADTDGDRLNDALEVSGFTAANGRVWYLDPFSADSNGDGITDFMECTGTTFCPDTDGDQLPDAFDPDNDNDGVPDVLDDAPTQVISGGPGANGGLLGVPGGQLTLALSSYTSTLPLAVDFTIRPVNPAHLWYDGSVLDWPSDDREGQIQRVLDTTLGTTGRLANGDLRLVPMLEIEIPYQAGTFGGLPVKASAVAAGLTDLPPLPAETGVITTDQQLHESWFNQWLDRDQLASYQISVQLKDRQRTLLAYLPLDVLHDPTGKQPVAFTARMLYRPLTASFGAAHQVRLSWAVQMLTDSCTPPASKSYQEYCSDTGHWQTTPGPQLVHTYYDDFVVSALKVTEHHGTAVAAAVQLPSGGTAMQQHLWSLARNLDRTFVGGRDCAAVVGGVCQRNGQRNLTVAEIKRRFDSGSNGGTTAIERWNIPATALRVQTYSFSDDADAGKLSFGFSEGGVAREPYLNQLLNAAYLPIASFGVTATTVLVARERSFRSADLANAATIGAGSVSLSFSELSLLTQAAMQWQPFQHTISNGLHVWTNMSAVEYVDAQAPVYSSLLGQPGGLSSPTAERLAGATALARGWYLAMMTGRSGLVAIEGRALDPGDPMLADSALGQPTTASGVLAGLAATLSQLVLDRQRQRTVGLAADSDSLLTALGRQRLYQDGGALLSLFGGLTGLRGGVDNSVLSGALSGVALGALDAEAADTTASQLIDYTTTGLGLIDTLVGGAEDALDLLKN